MYFIFAGFRMRKSGAKLSGIFFAMLKDLIKIYCQSAIITTVTILSVLAKSE